MIETNNSILSFTSDISFGKVNLNNKEVTFYKKLNQQIFKLCNKLPERVQTDSMLFMMNYFRCTLGLSFEFFKNYYAPSWLIIYHIVNLNNNPGLTQEEIEHSITAQSMAMFLHSLDDHLHDKSIPVSHLVLLIRSHAWMSMHEAINYLTKGCQEYISISKELINDYYDSISATPSLDTIDNYCDLFRKQMATWMIIPMINAKKITGNDDFMNAIKKSYESFGISWRLLDDINDIYSDLAKNIHSSIYISLPDHGKNLWREFSTLATAEEKKATLEKINLLLNEHAVIDTIIQRIFSELKNAENYMEGQGLSRFARQYQSLGETLTEWTH